ncbi:MAG: glycosyltransferase family 39 protein [Desulfobacterota bacterium]|nr:glycosyltransferase family 39 protein [Thermodesulfobacteriota bacterium]
MKVRLSQNLRNLVWYFSLLLCIALYLYHALRFSFTVDDAYISMRYARHLYEGKGLVYNIGDYVEGYSNFLWVIILAFWGALGCNLPVTANVLGIVSALLTLVIVFKLMIRIQEGVSFWTLIPILFLSTNWDFVGWATGGLETAFFTLLIFVTIYFFQKEAVSETGSYWFSAILCGLLCLTRPEGFLFSGFYFFVFCFIRFKRRSALLKPAAIWLSIFAAMVVPHEIWRFFYYGDFLPNSFYVKINKAEYFERGIRYVAYYVIQSYTYFWIPPILVGIIRRSPCIRFMFSFALLYLIYIAWVGGDWMAFRFFVPIIPLLAFLMGTGLKCFYDYALTIRHSFIRYILLFFLITYTSTALWLNALPVYKYGKHRNFIFDEKLQILDYGALHLPEENAIEVAKAFKKILLPDEVVAASFAGFTGLYTDIRVVDILGLNDKYIARLTAPKPGQPGHEKQAPFEYLLENKAICLYPWPIKYPGDTNSQYSVEYEPGKFLTFGSTLSYNEVVKKFQDRGFNVFYRGNFIPNPNKMNAIENNNNFNFETGTYAHWTVEGTAFDTAPQYRGKWGNSHKIKGYEGVFLVNSYYNNSDIARGRLISDTFKINGNTISFLIAGGNTEKTSINLVVDGKIVRTATGDRTEEMVRKQWKVEEYIHKDARIEIIDNASDEWGHIVLDDILICNF